MSNQAIQRIRLGVSVLLLVMAGITQAGTITVGPGIGYHFETIQAGIDAAVDGDTVLVAPGEYVITEPVTFRGKAITVKSEAEADETVIRMGTPTDLNRGSVVVFENNENDSSVLDGFTITGGMGCRLWFAKVGEAPRFWWEGGGILFNASSGTLRNCAIAQNRADVGGAVMVVSGSSAFLTNCIINENSATDPEGAGGGLCCADNSSATMTKCVIRANSTLGAGGGVVSYDNSSMTMTSCEMTSNTAEKFGGGIYVKNASMTLKSCVIAQNAGGWGGGGVGTSGGSYYGPPSFIEIANCTITGNFGAADAGGGGVASYGAGSLGDGSITITNSIVCGNTSAKGPEISLMSGEKIGISYSNVAGGQAGANVEGGSTLNWGAGNIDADPRFVSLGYLDDKGTRDASDDVWVKGDFHLKSQAGRWDSDSQTWLKDDVTSPCIDAGDPNSDWSGETWPHGGRINMGAYGGTREASMSTQPEAMSLPRVAFICRSDPEVAESFQSLLMSYGCPTTLLGVEDVTSIALESCDLIVLASDAGYANTWQDTPFVAMIEDSGKPIIGLGQGGYNFFGVLELWIGRPNGGHGSQNSIEVLDPDGSLFSTPYSVDIPEDRLLQLYTETDHVGIYLWPTIPETVTVLASVVDDHGYFPLVMEHNRYLFWGFTESPRKMTEVGKTLFINVVIWTANAGWEIAL